MTQNVAWTAILVYQDPDATLSMMMIHEICNYVAAAKMNDLYITTVSVDDADNLAGYSFWLMWCTCECMYQLG